MHEYDHRCSHVHGQYPSLGTRNLGIVLDYWAAVDLLELGTSVLYRQSETFHL